MFLLIHSHTSIPSHPLPEPSRHAGRELHATPKSSSLSISLHPSTTFPRTCASVPMRMGSTTPPLTRWSCHSSHCPRPPATFRLPARCQLRPQYVCPFPLPVLLTG